MPLPHIRLVPLVTAMAAAALLPSTAQGAEITFEGDTLVYRAAPGERNWVFIGNGPGGRLRLGDHYEATFPADRCEDVGGDGYACDMPNRVRLELGDNSDRNAFSDGYVGTTPVDVMGQGGNDTLEAHYEAPTPVVLDGGEGNDGLRGYGGDDVLLGGPGDDDLNGHGGRDELRGGEGNDTLSPDQNAEPSADIADGGPGVDSLVDYVQYFPGEGVYPPVGLTLDGGADDGRPGEGDDLSSIERITSHVSGRFALTDAAEDVNVWANMDGGASIVEGRGGNDILTGHDAVETLDGGAGDDRIEGGWNHDTLTGGPGKDLIYGDQTARCGTSDTVCVPYGNDVIEARDGEVDVIDCGPGTDRASVDAVDVHANCETVEVGGGAGGPAAPGGQGTPGGGGPVGAGGSGSAGQGGSGSGAALIGKPKLGTALAKGLKLRLTGARPGRGSVTAKVGKKTVGSGTVKVAPTGTATVTLRFTAAARRQLRSAKRVTLRVTGAGVKATIALKR